MLKDLKDVAVSGLLKIHNRIARDHDLDVKRPKRFSNRTQADKKLAEVLKLSGDGIIRLLQPEYVKRGLAAERWDMLHDLQSVAEYLSRCEENGHRRSDALRDLRYNQEHGLIKVVRV